MSAEQNSEERPLRDALKQFLRANKLEKGLDKVEIREVWHRLMGNGVQSYTTDVILRGDKLLVRLSSSVLREELSYGKQKIIDMINEEMGRPLVRELILA